MRIVATSDTHFPFTNDLIPDGDVFVHAGDLMYDGTPQEWEPLVASLAALPHKHKLLVPGNHDFHIQNYLGVAKAQLRKAGVKLLHEERATVTIDGMMFGGVPFVTGLYGWAFNRMEEQVSEFFAATPELFGCDVLITHSPPYRILDSTSHGDAGCTTYNRLYYNGGLEPKHWVCGHIHECYGTKKVYPESPTTFHNVAMCDRSYKQVNPAQVFDL